MFWNILYLTDVFSIGLFATSYYVKCYRKGYRIDFWHAQVFLLCVLPNQLMLFFARNDLNGIILGRELEPVTSAIPRVFLVTQLGYISMLAGGGLWRLRSGVGVREATRYLLNALPRASLMLMSSRRLLVFQSLLCLLLQATVLMVYFSGNGLGFDLRGYTMAHPVLRPFALVASFYTIIIASHCLARYVETKEKVLLACTLFLTIGMFFFGARGNVFSIYINVVLCYLVQLRQKVGLFRLFSIAAAFLLFALYLGNVRGGEYSLSLFFGLIIALLLFGNNFSDLRDFAWVYADWNHHLWLGRTYLAGMTAFVPRFASEFRDTWGLGAATGAVIGVDTHVHPGLRPGVFGEGFFNFGWAGACIVGLLLGVILRQVDTDTKMALQPSRPRMTRAFASTTLLSLMACVSISTNLSSLFVLLGVYLFTWLCLHVRVQINAKRISQ